ncbi:extracellular calcium-sensing receptor [Coregonus clupeaformis]|uniref:extracellular calcium-sensing receptor n=1 Tax=Coregonus clupeaformis TaxID=59861 RepID=UPI001BE026FD|nr:extracellular calcium-sensing receptor [Coregonus clupeaformis]
MCGLQRVILGSLPLLCIHTAFACELLGRFDMPSLFKAGDVMIGGIFPVFNKQENSNTSFVKEPAEVKCAGFDLRAFRWTQVMMFAIDEINKDSSLLPNVSLGYRILDSCASPTNTLRAALTLVSMPEEIEPTAPCLPPISALIAESGSSQSLALAGTLGPFRVPMVSYFSTCACLSDKAKYPTFFRTIPSDYHQAKALAALVKHFGWTWIGAIQSDNDYGRNGVLAFTEEVQKLGVCIAFVGTVLRTYPSSRILDVVDMIKQSTVKVILSFVPEGDLYPLMREVVRQNITHIQWIASEAWITAARPSTPEIYSSFGGTIGFGVRKMAIPKLRHFLMGISPYTDPKAAFVRDFWEKIVGCQPLSTGEPSGSERGSNMCTGAETLVDSQDLFFNVTQLRVSYNVYKAVYAVAHAINRLIFCKKEGESQMRPCVNLSQIQPTEVSDHLKTVHFINQFGEAVFFDANGDPPAAYDIINWQLRAGQVQHVTVGQFGLAANKAYELSIQEDNIVWRTGKSIPVAVCSQICPVGTRKAQIKGKPVCCFDCIPCADGTIANTTGAADCSPCPQEYWSNDGRDQCILKTVEFLSYHEPMGIALTMVSLLGACLSFATVLVFITYKDTPVVKASNSELSSLLLFSLFLCFLCPLTFIGRPTAWTCMLRHTAFGVTFALCISCMLGKTIVVVTAFRSTLPSNNNIMNWLGPKQQRVIIFCCTQGHVLICAAWLIAAPPLPFRNTQDQCSKIILECSVGSQLAFWCVLGYIGLLACLCFILAFLARKPPGNFNEAKFISFSMLIFCAVWISFIPAYVSSPGKYTVAVEIFAILASSFGLLFCLFAPKCYIILLKPEKNTKQHLMGNKKHFEVKWRIARLAAESGGPTYAGKRIGIYPDLSAELLKQQTKPEMRLYPPGKTYIDLPEHNTHVFHCQ